MIVYNLFPLLAGIRPGAAVESADRGVLFGLLVGRRPHVLPFVVEGVVEPDGGVLELLAAAPLEAVAEHAAGEADEPPAGGSINWRKNEKYSFARGSKYCRVLDKERSTMGCILRNAADHKHRGNCSHLLKRERQRGLAAAATAPLFKNPALQESIPA